MAPTPSDEEFEAALDELFGCLADVKPIGPSWRQIKEEEMALEEEKLGVILVQPGPDCSRRGRIHGLVQGRGRRFQHEASSRIS